MANLKLMLACIDGRVKPARVASDIARIKAKLKNPKFVQNAAEEIVEGEREKREEAEGRRAKILEALERLKGAA